MGWVFGIAVKMLFGMPTSHIGVPEFLSHILEGSK